jgi:hypothetical protein
LIDRPGPARGRRAPVCAASLGRPLLAALLLALLPAFPAAAGSRFDPGSEPAAPVRVYLPVISATGARPPIIVTSRTYLPLVSYRLAPPYRCPTSSAARWGQMSPRVSLIGGAAGSPDLNMDVRGWYFVAESLGFVQYPYPPGSPPDTEHPLRLSNIANSTVQSFVHTYQANDWDWLGCNCATPRNPSPYPVTMLGLRTTPGQELHIASRDRAVDPQGFTAMVLYADAGQIALKYTWEDRVDEGYLVHLVSLCVDPNLVALYRRLDAEGRHELPGVTNSSVIGTAQGGEVDVIVRDSGAFLDPRSRQDWWQDQPQPAAWSR